MASVDSFQLFFSEVAKKGKRLQELLALIGLLYVGKQAITLTYHVLNGSRIHFLSKLCPQNLSNYGQWAMITGGSDGIGKAFAYALAMRNINLLLIARSEDKLQSIACDLVQKFNVKVEILSGDFAKRSIYEEIDVKFVNKDIGILINNVADVPIIPSLFHRISRIQLLRSIDVNLVPMLLMTSKVLPSMIEKRKGLVINVSSTAGVFPFPFMSTYSSAKAFMDFFSRVINYEYKDKGIVVLSLVPNYVPKNSDVGTIRQFFQPNTTLYAENALSTVGYTNRTGGHWMHDVINYIFSVLPESIRLSITAYFARKHFDLEVD